MSIGNFGDIKFRTEKFHEASTYRLLYGVVLKTIQKWLYP